jgi:hypothetical protein
MCGVCLGILLRLYSLQWDLGSLQLLLSFNAVLLVSSVKKPKDQGTYYFLLFCDRDLWVVSKLLTSLLYLGIITNFSPPPLP